MSDDLKSCPIAPSELDILFRWEASPSGRYDFREAQIRKSCTYYLKALFILGSTNIKELVFYDETGLGFSVGEETLNSINNKEMEWIEIPEFRRSFSGSTWCWQGAEPACTNASRNGVAIANELKANCPCQFKYRIVDGSGRERLFDVPKLSEWPFN